MKVKLSLDLLRGIFTHGLEAISMSFDESQGVSGRPIIAGLLVGKERTHF